MPKRSPSLNSNLKMFDPSPVDNAEVYKCYLKAKEAMEQAATAMKELEEKLVDKFMTISKTEKKPIDDSMVTIGSASWCLKLQSFRVKQARAKSRIMSPCDTTLID